MPKTGRILATLLVLFSTGHPAQAWNLRKFQRPVINDTSNLFGCAALSPYDEFVGAGRTVPAAGRDRHKILGMIPDNSPFNSDGTAEQPSQEAVRDVAPVVRHRLRNRDIEFQKRFASARDILSVHTALSSEPNKLGAILRCLDARFDAAIPILRDILAFRMADSFYTPRPGDVIELTHRTDGKFPAHASHLGNHRARIVINHDKRPSGRLLEQAFISETAHVVMFLVHDSLSSSGMMSDHLTFPISKRAIEVLDFSDRHQYALSAGRKDDVGSAIALARAILGPTRPVSDPDHEPAVNISLAIQEMTRVLDADPVLRERLFGLTMHLATVIIWLEPFEHRYDIGLIDNRQTAKQYYDVARGFRKVRSLQGWEANRASILDALDNVCQRSRQDIGTYTFGQQLFSPPNVPSVGKARAEQIFDGLERTIQELRNGTMTLEELKGHSLYQWFQRPFAERASLTQFLGDYLKLRDLADEAIDHDFESISTPQGILDALENVMPRVKSRIDKRDSRAAEIVGGIESEMAAARLILAERRPLDMAPEPLRMLLRRHYDQGTGRIDLPQLWRQLNAESGKQLIYWILRLFNVAVVLGEGNVPVIAGRAAASASPVSIDVLMHSITVPFLQLQPSHYLPRSA